MDIEGEEFLWFCCGVEEEEKRGTRASSKMTTRKQTKKQTNKQTNKQTKSASVSCTR